MEPSKIIAVFIKWLQTNPDVFLPEAWQELPDLDENLADCDDEELFPIAHTLSKWCAKHQLGDKLKQAALQIDAGDSPARNQLQLLQQSIQNRYNAFLKSP